MLIKKGGFFGLPFFLQSQKRLFFVFPIAIMLKEGRKCLKLKAER